MHGDNGDNEMKPGAMHRSGIHLTALRLRKTSARRPFGKGCEASLRLKWGQYLGIPMMGNTTYAEPLGFVPSSPIH